MTLLLTFRKSLLKLHENPKWFMISCDGCPVTHHDLSTSKSLKTSLFLVLNIKQPKLKHKHRD